MKRRRRADNDAHRLEHVVLPAMARAIALVTSVRVGDEQTATALTKELHGRRDSWHVTTTLTSLLATCLQAWDAEHPDEGSAWWRGVAAAVAAEGCEDFGGWGDAEC